MSKDTARKLLIEAGDICTEEIGTNERIRLHALIKVAVGILEADMAEARKKPEPTELSKKAQELRRKGATSEQWEYASLLMDVCDENDHLAAELATLKDECTCEECEKSFNDPETGVTALCMTCWNAMVTKLRADFKTKDERIKEIQEYIRKNSGHHPSCGKRYGLHYACTCGFEQALKENDGKEDT